MWFKGINNELTFICREDLQKMHKKYLLEQKKTGVLQARLLSLAHKTETFKRNNHPSDV